MQSAAVSNIWIDPVVAPSPPFWKLFIDPCNCGTPTPGAPTAPPLLVCVDDTSMPSAPSQPPVTPTPSSPVTPAPIVPPTPTPKASPTIAPVDPPTFAPVVSPTFPPGTIVEVLLNAGGPTFTDGDGNTWLADGPYVTSPGTQTYAVSDAISGKNADTIEQLYQSERYGTIALSHLIDNLPNGNYDVYLHFAEIYFQAAGLRTFTAKLQGDDIFSGPLDLWGVSNARFVAHVEHRLVPVTNGELSIELDGIVNNAKISGIEIRTVIPVGTPAPVVPPTPAPVTPSPTTAAVVPPTPAPVTPSPSLAPVVPPTPAPVVPPTPAPVVPPTQAPVTPSPTTAPVVPPTPAPVTPSPTTAPVVPPTPAPVVPPTPAPVTPSPSLAPVVPPTPAPVVPPTPAPVTPSPTTAPVVPPTPAPVTPLPTPAPIVPPTPAPVVPPTPAPATPPPTLAPVSPPTTAPVVPPSPAPVTPLTLAPVSTDAPVAATAPPVSSVQQNGQFVENIVYKHDILEHDYQWEARLGDYDILRGANGDIRDYFDHYGITIDPSHHVNLTGPNVFDPDTSLLLNIPVDCTKRDNNFRIEYTGVGNNIASKAKIKNRYCYWFVNNHQKFCPLVDLMDGRAVQDPVTGAMVRPRIWQTCHQECSQYTQCHLLGR